MADPSHPGRGVASIRVVYALPDRQEIVDLEVEPRMNVAEAVARSGLPKRFPEIAAKPLVCAIFGQPAALTRSVRPGDRIEILRPLLIDPKENRRRTAARARSGNRVK